MAQEEKAKEPTVTFQAKGGLLTDPKPMEVHAGVGDIKPWDADSWAQFEQMGKPRPRAEAPLKVTGRATYTYDVKLPGMLHGRMIGAAIPAGEIVSIDTSKAEALPGVKAVWTAESRVVRFAGQDVAAVAAVSPEIAMDAARLVKVTYKESPFVHELREAMKDGAPLVYDLDKSPAGPDVPRRGNVFGPGRGRGRGDVEKGFAEAEVVHEGTYYCPVHTHSPLETHGVVASWEGDQLTVYASTQGIFAVREGLAEALGIDRKNVRVICEHMGGGFGSKLGPSASGSAFAMTACKLAKRAGAPVKMMLDRKQQHLCTGNAPSALMTVKVGAKKDGTMTAVHYKSWGSAGVAGGAGTAGPAGALHGKNPNFKAEEYDVFTNAGPAAPLRAPGHSQGAFGIESAVDELAEKLGLDPIELRKKNEASPVRMAQYDLGAKEIGWARRNKKAGDMSTGGFGPAKGAKKRGIGMANGNWYVFAAEDSNAQVKVHRDGSVEVITGCQDIGTGYRTAMMVVAAEELGIAPEAVTVRLGDTQFPEGPGSGGSVTINSMAPVVRLAANQARTKLLALAAPLARRRGRGARRRERDDLRGEGQDEVGHVQAGRGEDERRDDRLPRQARQAVRDLPRRPRGHAVRRGRGGHRDRRGARPQDGLGERLRAPGEPPHHPEPGDRGHDPGRVVGAAREPHPGPPGGDDGQPQPRVVQDLRPRRHVRGEVDPHPRRQPRQQHLDRGHRRAADRAHPRGDRERRLQRDRRPHPRAADHPRPGPRGPVRSEEEGLAMNRFELARATTPSQARELLAEKAGSVLKAGGIDLIDHLKEHLVEPPRVVDIKTIPGLDKITAAGDGSLRIGALVTLAKVAASTAIRKTHPALAQACAEAASPQVRNVATIGGNVLQRPRCWYYRLESYKCVKKGGDVCFAVAGENRYNVIFGGGPAFPAHPSSAAVPLVAYGASFVLDGPKGPRTVPAAEFFVLPAKDPTRENVLQPGEVLLEIRVPSTKGWKSAYLEARERAAFDWALVSAAVALKVEGGVVKDARVVLGQVATIPWRAAAAEKALVGKPVGAASAEAAGKAAVVGAEPMTDNGYKVDLVTTLVRRTVASLA